MPSTGETLKNQHVPIWELQVSIQQPAAAPRRVAGSVSTGSRTATQVPIQQPIGGDVSWLNHMRSMSRKITPKNGAWESQTATRHTRQRHPPAAPAPQRIGG